MFVSLRRTQTWRLHTKLYKFGWHTSANNARMKNSRELIFGKVVSIVSQTLHFFHWMVTIFILITWLVKTENWKNNSKDCLNDITTVQICMSVGESSGFSWSSPETETSSSPRSWSGIRMAWLVSFLRNLGPARRLLWDNWWSSPCNALSHNFQMKFSCQKTEKRIHYNPVWQQRLCI